MTALRDRAAIRAILRRDRFWSVYALGDLAPGYFEHCDWFADGDELALIYRATNPPVLFLSGSAIPGDVPRSRSYYLHIREGAVLEVARHFKIETKQLWRMVLETARFEAPPNGLERLAWNDVPALERLYADGIARGEAPDFFFPSMVERRVFFGIREGTELIAAAGTHLVTEEEDVAAVGKVYTRADRRARGYGMSGTSGGSRIDRATHRRHRAASATEQRPRHPRLLAAWLRTVLHVD